MKILLVNKFHYLKGGSEKYYFELAELLRKNGHEVAFFSMQNEKNIKTNCKEYFTENFELNSNNKLKAVDIIYSRENKRKMKEVLENFKPDIVHLNNFQRQLSASIIDAIKEKNIPIVFTAHDLQSICPNKTMLDNEKKICQQCIQGNYFNCIKKRCIEGSRLKSSLGAIEAQYYKMKNIYIEKINKIITPSEFYKKQLIKSGISENKIIPMHNFIDINQYNLETEDNGYALYLGRLSEEKGIINLINAFGRIKQGQLHIAGEGPEIGKIKQFIKENNLQDKVKLLGFLNEDEIKESIRKCRFVVIPSIWYDNCPYSVMETLVIGKPVIGSDMGGIPELVKNNENGLIFKHNSIEDLTDKMKILFRNTELVKKFSENARNISIKLYSKENYYKKIVEVYDELIREVKYDKQVVE